MPYSYAFISWMMIFTDILAWNGCFIERCESIINIRLCNLYLNRMGNKANIMEGLRRSALCKY